ncbi:MAG: hypothetical protein NVSMB52_07950 [Chloroflexota bacterium]
MTSSQVEGPGGIPHSNILAETDRILSAAESRGIPLRLMGGLAIHRTCPCASEPPLAREYKDIDVVAPGATSRQLGNLLEECGYAPDKHFNALRGDRRLFYWDEANKRQFDVFVDRFQMCHSIDLRDRLTVPAERSTMPLADLLLMKLQVVELNLKDMQDLAALLQDHAISADPDSIDIGYIGKLTGKDWGLHHTICINIGKMRDHTPSLGAPNARFVLASQLDALQSALDFAPKSTGWKLRARVGERVSWYDLPEEEVR